MSWALAEVTRTVASTILYALGAAIVAVVLALLWTLAVGREPRRLVISTGLLLPLLALPPAAPALGAAQLAALAPDWADAVVRGRFAVCAILAMRLAPLAALVVLRGYEATPRSWTLAAALHGVSLLRFLRVVLLPALRPSVLVAGLLVALLSCMDITTVLMLHPPGHGSLPLAIFTVMANAPEAQVAALSLLYVGSAALALVALWSFAARAVRA